MTQRMWKKSSSLLAALVVVGAFGLAQTAAVYADPYDGMCADNNDTGFPVNCEMASFMEGTWSEYTDCEFWPNNPSCPSGTSPSVVVGEESCGPFGGGDKLLCVDTCTVNGECVQCQDGFYGDGSGECLYACACENGECNDDLDGDGSCACFPGWTGDACGECALGYYGSNCTPCECGVLGICDDGWDGTGECSCEGLYEWNGQECAIGLCETDPPIEYLDEGATPCEGSANGFQCTFVCVDGYGPSGPSECVLTEWVGGSCINLNECELGTDTCDAQATCTDTEGGFKCACLPGFVGDGKTCSNINECEEETDTCAVKAKCTDTDGSFECACVPGYEGDGYVCDNIDECAEGTALCGDNATCEDSPGSYVCACEEGYFGDGLTCCKDEDNDGVCTAVDNCPGISNPAQLDSDGDKTGDLCECLEGVSCDDENGCTDDTCDPEVGCVHTPNQAACDDGDVCTVTACAEGSCQVESTVENCCTQDFQCGPGEQCIEEDTQCVAVQCTSCDVDEDCGKGNACQSYASGMVCVAGCALDKEICGEDATCVWEEGENAEAFCIPKQGDCVCAPTDEVACQDGVLVAVDSCGAFGDAVNDCEGWGCEDGTCLDEPEGSEYTEGGSDATEGEESDTTEEEESDTTEEEEPDTSEEESDSEEEGTEQGGDSQEVGVDSEGGELSEEEVDKNGIPAIEELAELEPPSVGSPSGGGCQQPASGSPAFPGWVLALGLVLFGLKRAREQSTSV